MKIRNFQLLIWCAIGVLLLSSSIEAATYEDVIDTSQHFQKMAYFAASDCWSIQYIGGWSEANRQHVAELLFSKDHGIGLSGWRFNLGGGPDRQPRSKLWNSVDCFEVDRGRYDWSKCANARWFLRAAKGYGVDTFIAFCNSPPKRLTRNHATYGEVDPSVSNNLQPGMEGQFATYISDILQHFHDSADASERINFRWVSPINEPEWDWVAKQEGTRAANEDIVRQFRAVDSELKVRKLPTHILGPESGSIPDMFGLNRYTSGKYKKNFGDYIELLCRPEFADALDRNICYHSYWSEGDDQLVQHRKQLRAKLDQHPDWTVAESEYCIMSPKRDLTMNAALHAMRVMQCDLDIVNVSAWSWWLAVSNGDYKDGLIYTNWKKPGDDETIFPSKLFWSLGNFSRFVRPGMVRVGINSTGAAHDLKRVAATAYLDESSGRVVAVYINFSNESTELKLSLRGQEKTTWQPYVTTDSAMDNLRPFSKIAEGQTFGLPPRSVVTLVNEK